MELTKGIDRLTAGTDCDFESWNRGLLCIAILSSLYDIVSTVLSVRAVGYMYEGNTIIKEIIHWSGIAGFAGVKFSLTVLALFVVYYIIKNRDAFGWESVKMFYAVYAGTIASSLFVATSNLSVVYAGSSFYFLNLDALQIGLILMFVAPLAGFLLDVRSYSRSAAAGYERNVFTRAGSIMIAYVNHLQANGDIRRSRTKK